MNNVEDFFNSIKGIYYNLKSLSKKIKIKQKEKHIIFVLIPF